MLSLLIRYGVKGAPSPRRLDDVDTFKRNLKNYSLQLLQVSDLQNTSVMNDGVTQTAVVSPFLFCFFVVVFFLFFFFVFVCFFLW